MLSKTNQYPTRTLATASHLKAAPIPSASPEQRMAALEQQVAQMQQYIQQLLAVITVEGNGQKLKLKAPTVEVDALVDVKLKAGVGITMDCQHDLVAKSQGDLKLDGYRCTMKAMSTARVEGATGATLNASASIAEVKGIAVVLNNGNMPVARKTDPVAGNVIAHGNTTVFA